MFDRPSSAFGGGASHPSAEPPRLQSRWNARLSDANRLPGVGADVDDVTSALSTRTFSARTPPSGTKGVPTAGAWGCRHGARHGFCDPNGFQASLGIPWARWGSSGRGRGRLLARAFRHPVWRLQSADRQGLGGEVGDHPAARTFSTLPPGASVPDPTGGNASDYSVLHEPDVFQCPGERSRRCRSGPARQPRSGGRSRTRMFSTLLPEAIALSPAGGMARSGRFSTTRTFSTAPGSARAAAAQARGGRFEAADPLGPGRFPLSFRKQLCPARRRRTHHGGPFSSARTFSMSAGTARASNDQVRGDRFESAGSLRPGCFPCTRGTAPAWMFSTKERVLGGCEGRRLGHLEGAEPSGGQDRGRSLSLCVGVGVGTTPSGRGGGLKASSPGGSGCVFRTHSEHRNSRAPEPPQLTSLLRFGFDQAWLDPCPIPFVHELTGGRSADTIRGFASRTGEPGAGRRSSSAAVAVPRFRL